MPRNDLRPIERLHWTAGSTASRATRRKRRIDPDHAAPRTHVSPERRNDDLRQER